MNLRILSLFLVLLALAVNDSAGRRRHSRQSGKHFSEKQKRALEKIQLLAREGGLPKDDWKGITEFDKDVCYEEVCLDSALEIMTATNFSVDPCKPNMWLNFVCARRVDGPDNINQLERLMKIADSQTKQLLEDKSGKYDKEFLLKEAQAYFYQCKNKALNDDQDIKDILEYTKANYGGWPLMTNRDPGKNFDWLEMVADLNRIERYGFTPLLFKVKWEGQGIQMSIGQTSFTHSVEDYIAMLKAVQKASGLRKPARLDQLGKMNQFVNTAKNNLQYTKSDMKTMTIAELQKETDEYMKKQGIKLVMKPIKWLEFFQRVFNGSDIKITAASPIISLPFDNVMGVILAVNYFYTNDETKPVSNALHFQFISALAQETTTLLDDLNTFKCLDQTGPREQICLSRITETFGYSLGKTYLKAFYNDSDMTPAIQELMKKIQQGYIDVIDENEWMEDKTKKFLTDKVNSIKTYIAEPDWTKKRNGVQKFYKGFPGSPDKTSSYPLNYLKINNWETMKKAEWTLKIANIDDLRNFHIYDISWSRYLGTVQAQFHKIINEARIEGGITQAPLFETSRPGFMNYGGLGMVLAHEIGHSFDRTGRLYDTNGNKGEFWDSTSRDQYNKWVQTIVDDYSSTAHQTSDSSAETIDALKTVDEDISDILAVYISFFSYKEYLTELEGQGHKEKVLPGLKNYTPQKLFFMKYGNMWCDKKDVQDHYTDLLSDHSSGNTRAVMPLKRSKQFAETFGCDLPEQNTTKK